MPDEPGATPATPEGGAKPPAPAAPAPPATGDDALGDPGKRALDEERAARREAEKRAATTEAELKKIKDAQLSETERREARLAELESQNATLAAAVQRHRLEAAATAAARKANFWDPDLAYALLDQSAVEFDADGKPKNVEALVKAIAADKPRLINGGAGAPDFGGGHRGAPAGGGGDMNEAIRRAAGRA